MSPLNIIIPVVVFVIIIICGIIFYFLKKCIRWRVVSLVNPKKRSMSDESIIQNNAYTLESTDGHYQTLGSLPTLDIEQISSWVKFVEGDKYTPEFSKGRNSFRKSFREKVAHVTSRSQEIILNKRQMGVYNIPENELKYYKENCLKYKINGETNLNFKNIGSEENLELNRSDVGCNLTPNSNLRIDEMSNKSSTSNSRLEKTEEPLNSYSKTEMSSELISPTSRKEMFVEPLSPEAIQRIETCLRNKIAKTSIVMKKVEVTTTSVVVSEEEIIKENDCIEVTEQDKNISRK